MRARGHDRATPACRENEQSAAGRTFRRTANARAGLGHRVPCVIPGVAFSSVNQGGLKVFKAK